MSEFFPTMRICIAALCDIAYAMAAGVLLNRLWLGRSSVCNHRLRICLSACSALLLLVLPLQLFLLAASMTGDSSWADAWNAVPDVVTTHPARALISSFCFVPCLFLFACFSASLTQIRVVFLGLGLVAGFIACRACYGHAASDGSFTLREGIQFLHLSSIAIWGGGILVAGLITIPRLVAQGELDDVVQFGNNLSRTVTFALAVVILSGSFNAWKGLGGSLSAFPHSDWGKMLSLKLCFVLLAFGHGVRVRFLLHSHNPWTRGQTKVLRYWVRAEALLMLSAFVCSAWLSNLPPADM